MDYESLWNELEQYLLDKLVVVCNNKNLRPESSYLMTKCLTTVLDKMEELKKY